MRIVVASIVFFLEVDDDDGDAVEDVAVVANRAVCFPKQAVSDACFFPKQEVVGTV